MYDLQFGDEDNFAVLYPFGIPIKAENAGVSALPICLYIYIHTYVRQDCNYI